MSLLLSPLLLSVQLLQTQLLSPSLPLLSRMQAGLHRQTVQQGLGNLACRHLVCPLPHILQEGPQEVQPLQDLTLLPSASYRDMLYMQHSVLACMQRQNQMHLMSTHTLHAMECTCASRH